MSAPLTKERREQLWRTSNDGRLIGDHPDRHPLLRDYEATVCALETERDALRAALEEIQSKLLCGPRGIACGGDEWLSHGDVMCSCMDCEIYVIAQRVLSRR